MEQHSPLQAPAILYSPDGAAYEPLQAPAILYSPDEAAYKPLQAQILLFCIPQMEHMSSKGKCCSVWGM